MAVYAQAVRAGNTGLAQFYRQSLARSALLPVLDRWQVEIAAGQTPAADPGSGLRERPAVGVRVGAAAGDAAAADGQQAGDYAGAYILNTIVLAVALFFAGVTSSFRYRPARALLIVLSLTTLAFAASGLTDLPIA